MSKPALGGRDDDENPQNTDESRDGTDQTLPLHQACRHTIVILSMADGKNGFDYAN